MWQSSTGLGGHSKQQTIHKMASSWRFPDSEWTHGHDHRHGWALGKQIVPQHVFGEDDENKRGFYMQIGILKVKSLNLGLWLYIIGFLIWVMGHISLAFTTFLYNNYYRHRALSGFKADFGPLLGTSETPARNASRNMKMFEFDLLYIFIFINSEIICYIPFHTLYVIYKLINMLFIQL
jgi:hypothetical protein